MELSQSGSITAGACCYNQDVVESLVHLGPASGLFVLTSFTDGCIELIGVEAPKAKTVRTPDLGRFRFDSLPVGFWARSSASLDDVVKASVFQDQTGDCLGAMLVYSSGAVRALGQCRIGKDSSSAYYHPKHLSIDSYHSRGHVSGQRTYALSHCRLAFLTERCEKHDQTDSCMESIKLYCRDDDDQGSRLALFMEKCEMHDHSNASPAQKIKTQDESWSHCLCESAWDGCQDVKADNYVDGPARVANGASWDCTVMKKGLYFDFNSSETTISPEEIY